MTDALPYAEGSWFAVPLRNGHRYGFGVVARHNREGIALGYFFGPASADFVATSELSCQTPSDAVAVRLFGDASLIDAKWPVLGRHEAWRRSEWPVPEFGSYIELAHVAL